MDSLVIENIGSVFGELTNKQHEVLTLVADNFTSKEIAYDLGISESAVNQRIECVRSRTGALPRAELARLYRKYLQGTLLVPEAEVPQPLKAVVLESGPESACTCGVSRLGLPQASGTREVDAPTAARLAGAPEVASGLRGPQVKLERAIVPRMLDGANAGLNRAAAIVVIASGLLLATMMGLGVLRSLSQVV